MERNLDRWVLKRAGKCRYKLEENSKEGSQEENVNFEDFDIERIKEREIFLDFAFERGWAEGVELQEVKKMTLLWVQLLTCYGL